MLNDFFYEFIDHIFYLLIRALIKFAQKNSKNGRHENQKTSLSQKN